MGDQNKTVSFTPILSWMSTSKHAEELAEEAKNVSSISVISLNTLKSNGQESRNEALHTSPITQEATKRKDLCVVKTIENESKTDWTVQNSSSLSKSVTCYDNGQNSACKVSSDVKLGDIKEVTADAISSRSSFKSSVSLYSDTQTAFLGKVKLNRPCNFGPENYTTYLTWSSQSNVATVDENYPANQKLTGCSKQNIVVKESASESRDKIKQLSHFSSEDHASRNIIGPERNCENNIFVTCEDFSKQVCYFITGHFKRIR